MTDLGSSPLARGTLRFGNRGIPMPRLIPARAGNTGALNGIVNGPAAHPRSRGEHHGGGVPVRQQPGSSPLARGTHASDRCLMFAPRLIPARAGNTLRIRERLG